MLRQNSQIDRISRLAPRNKRFTGRQEKMKELEDLLQPDQNSGRFAHGRQIITVYGIPGVGKSEFVLEYAHRHHDEYQLMYWIRCANNNSKIYFERFANDLNFNVKSTSEMVVVERVYDYIKNLDSYLLVFDCDTCDVTKYLPREDQLKPMQHVIITAHSSKGCQNPFELDVFSDSDAYNYVSALLHAAVHHDADNKDDIMQLCHLLGKLPLALSQAVAYIKECKCDIKSYIKIFNNLATALLKQKITFDNNCKHSVFTNLLTAVEKVVGKNPLFQPTYGPGESATTLLKCFSVLDSENIPLWLFGESCFFSEQDTLKIYDAVRTLRSYALITPCQKPEHYRIHRLLQHVIREYKEQDLNDSLPSHFAEKMLNCLTKAMVKVLPEGYKDHCGWKNVDADRLEKLSTLSPHVCSLLMHIDKALATYKSHAEKEEHSYVEALKELKKCKPGLLEVAGYCAYYKRDFSDGVKFFRNLVEIEEDADRKAPALHILGSCLRRIPNCHKEAVECFDGALELLNDSSPRQTITVIVEKAKSYFFVGEYSIAEKLLKDALDLQNSCLPDDKELLCYILPELGNVAYIKGQYQVAKKHFLTCLDIRSQQLTKSNEEHILIILCRFGVAKTMMSLGEYKDCEMLFLYCLDAARNYLGENHAYIGKVYGAIGKCLILQEKYEQASEHLENALINFSRNYGEDSEICCVIHEWLLHANDHSKHPFEDNQKLLLLGF